MENTLLIKNPSETERTGLIQFFEMAFELAWKLLKDYLELEGFTCKSPRDAIKLAFQARYIKDGHTWIDGLKARNLTVHTYEETIAIEVENKIRNSYFQILADLYHDFKQKE